MRTHEVKKRGQFLFKLNHYLRYGYVHYYSRTIPEHKSKEEIDKKLVLLYDVTYNRALRAARKKKGIRNIIYLRHKSQFILLTTEGSHPEFDRLKFNDFRTKSFIFHNYSVIVKNQKPSIKIEHRRYNQLRKKAQIIAHHQHEKVEEFLRGVSPFTFKGINQQRWKLYKLVNQKRKSGRIKKIKWGNIKNTSKYKTRLEKQ